MTTLTRIAALALIEAQGKNLFIPNDYDRIADNAFENIGIESVVLHNGITEIGSYAFARNNSLASVEIPSGVITIGNGAFYGNKITSLSFSNSQNLKTIGKNAFEKNNINRILIPEGVDLIGDYAFLGNSSTYLKIPDSLTNIGNASFYGNNFEFISVPNEPAFDLSLLPSGVEIKKRGVSSVSRLYNTSEGKHLFSSNQNEIDTLISSGWENEGTVYNEPDVATADVFRFYIAKENRHFYTALEYERDLIINNKNLTEEGWQYEGKVFSAYSTSDFPENAIRVVRYLNQGTGSHLYSTSTYEQSLLDQDANWLNEGIAWYGDLVL